MTRETDARMLLEWCALFAKAGFTPEELQEATEWLALHAPASSLRRPSDHLATLRERVRSRRAERARKEEMLRERERRRRILEEAEQARLSGGITRLSDAFENRPGDCEDSSCN